MQALEAAFDELYPGMVDIDIVDIWTHHAPSPLNKFVGAYRFLAKHPFLWKALWEYGRFPLTRRFSKVSHQREREKEVESLACFAPYLTCCFCGRSNGERYRPDISVRPPQKYHSRLVETHLGESILRQCTSAPIPARSSYEDTKFFPFARLAFF